MTSANDCTRLDRIEELLAQTDNRRILNRLEGLEGQGGQG